MGPTRTSFSEHNGHYLLHTSSDFSVFSVPTEEGAFLQRVELRIFSCGTLGVEAWLAEVRYCLVVIFDGYGSWSDLCFLIATV